MKGGAAGLSMGRNVFQREDADKFIKAACQIVHEEKSVDEALEVLRS